MTLFQNNSVILDRIKCLYVDSLNADFVFDRTPCTYKKYDVTLTAL